MLMLHCDIVHSVSLIKDPINSTPKNAMPEFPPLSLIWILEGQLTTTASFTIQFLYRSQPAMRRSIFQNPQPLSPTSRTLPTWSRKKPVASGVFPSSSSASELLIVALSLGPGAAHLGLPLLLPAQLLQALGLGGHGRPLFDGGAEGRDDGVDDVVHMLRDAPARRDGHDVAGAQRRARIVHEEMRPA